MGTYILKVDRKFILTGLDASCNYWYDLRRDKATLSKSHTHDVLIVVHFACSTRQQILSSERKVREYEDVIFEKVLPKIMYYCN